jgi:anthranilate phosphoribosyltransferase
MIKEAIDKVVKRLDLTEPETHEVFEEIMSGKATVAQISSFITALHMKGETVEEITGAARVMREKSLKVNINEEEVVDTCGTGGSGIDTFNISTTAAFVVAGGGLKVAKHGNRSALCQCGSADVLEALGVNLDTGTEVVDKCLHQVGIAFLYAPLFHSAMKYAVQPRKEIGIRTIFNLLGPLSNPANATSQVVGIYDAGLTKTVAEVLKKLGLSRAFVVSGLDRLDEITITGKTKVAELEDSKIRTYYITPEKFGLKKAKIEDIKGGDAKENAKILLSVLNGEKGPRRDIVLMNASAALVAGNRAKDMTHGIKIAADSIDSGAALDKLNQLISIMGKR